MAVFGKVVQHAHGETPFQFLRNLHCGVQQKIRDELGRIVPAKVLEVEKHDLPAAPSKSVVKSEIRRAERSFRHWDFLITPDLRRLKAREAPLLNLLERRR